MEGFEFVSTQRSKDAKKFYFFSSSEICVNRRNLRETKSFEVVCTQRRKVAKKFLIWKSSVN